ncbi:MAG TPA: PAS domain-containing sensor histidine kinase [Candidatus Binatia bacterium]|nr:PAS domain-containing sensor histidine kinase [Candidatus Binatia bacterium]
MIGAALGRLVGRWRRRASGASARASLERLAAAVDDAPIVAYAFDQTGVITFVQGRGLELIGQPPEGLIGRSVFTVLAPYPEIISAAERALQGEERPLRAEAFDREWEIRSRLSRSRRGVEVVGVATDITEQASAQRALEASEALFRAVVENLSDVINVVRADGTVSLIAGAAAEVSGQTDPPAALGLDDVYDEDRPRLATAMADLISRPGGTARERFRYRHPDGTLHHLETTARNALDNPAVRGLIAVTRDITDLIRAQEELRTSEERFRALVQQSTDVISVFGADGTRLYSSPGASRLYGLPLEELPSSAMESVCEEDRDRVMAIFRKIAEGSRVTSITPYRIRRANGEVRDVESTARSAIDDPAVRGIIVNSRDVTERARAEAELRRIDDQRRDLLSHLVKAQEEERHRIAADLHDDVVQQLTAINLRLEVLKSRADLNGNENVGALQQLVTESTRRMRDLLYELHPPPLEQHGLAAALRAQLEQFAATTGIAVDLRSAMSVEPDTNARTVLFRIAQEALQNVRKHAEAGRVVIELRTGSGGTQVRVRDDGRGLPPTFTSTPPSGHLGLAFMEERARLAGGWWRIGMAPGGGTLVEFWVPGVEDHPTATQPIR